MSESNRRSWSIAILAMIIGCNGSREPRNDHVPSNPPPDATGVNASETAQPGEEEAGNVGAEEMTVARGVNIKFPQSTNCIAAPCNINPNRVADEPQLPADLTTIKQIFSYKIESAGRRIPFETTVNTVFGNSQMLDDGQVVVALVDGTVVWLKDGRLNHSIKLARNLYDMVNVDGQFVAVSNESGIHFLRNGKIEHKYDGGDRNQFRIVQVELSNMTNGQILLTSYNTNVGGMVFSNGQPIGHLAPDPLSIHSMSGKSIFLGPDRIASLGFMRDYKYHFRVSSFESEIVNLEIADIEFQGANTPESRMVAFSPNQIALNWNDRIDLVTDGSITKSVPTEEFRVLKAPSNVVAMQYVILTKSLSESSVATLRFVDVDLNHLSVTVEGKYKFEEIATPVLIRKDLAAFGLGDGSFRIYGPDGQKFNFETSGMVLSAPIITKDGWMIIVSQDGQVYWLK
jgi:hypothetical protein